MTSWCKHYFNDNRSQFDGAEEGGEDKISEFLTQNYHGYDFAYSLTYGNNNREKQIIGNSIMISANTDLTPKWKAGISTGYDFVQKELLSHKFVSNAIY
jgi:hypothetical protein